jgi:hypothetical protein
MIHHVKRATKVLIYVFAIIGLALVGVYFAVRFHLTNVTGIIDNQSETFWNNQTLTNTENNISNISPENYCLLSSLAKNFPAEVKNISELILANQDILAQQKISALSSAIGDNKNYKNEQERCLNKKLAKITPDQINSLLGNIKSPFAWANTPEWQTFKIAVSRDVETLNTIEKATGIKKRLLVAELAAEQLRLFNSERAIFEQVFAPLKILGSQSQFSWGIMGLKPETAEKIESNLTNTTSPFYLGKNFETALKFNTSDTEQERFARITDEHNHYYAYLYSALYNKQIINQWQKAGFDISNRPEILATLYNIGFTNSTPKADPQMGGAQITVGDKDYSFGRLAYEFYYSDEITEEFPY